jgi:hypothetical protein
LCQGYLNDEQYKSYTGYEFTVFDTDTSHMKYPYPQEERFNSHDFSNSLFTHIDRMNADVLMDYWNGVTKRRGGMDGWLDERGYIDTNYWCDIIGTHLLREMRFAEAEQWLAKVSPRYQQRLNTCDYMAYDPFSYEPTPLRRFRLPGLQKEVIFGAANYKLCFARRMADLERQAGEAASPDDRADALLSLSIALRNAFGECCWPLVAYGYSSYVGFVDDTGDYPMEWWDDVVYSTPYENPYYLASDMASAAVASCAVRAEQRAAAWRKQAFATYRDRDRIARAFLRTCQFDYLMHHYADTPTGQDIARHCDKWKDYRR